MTVPFASGLLTRTTSWTDPEPPAASAPIDQLTTPPDCVPPPVADTNVVLTGTVSDSTTAVAPEFRSVAHTSELQILPPAATRPLPSKTDTVRTGAEVTVVVMALPLIGAVSVESTLNFPFVMTVPFASGFFF